MKNHMYRSATSLALLLFAPLFAQAGDAATKSYNSDQVSVSWTDPAKFTEALYGPQFRQTSPEVWLVQFQKTLVKRADDVLPAGQHLEVTITDVDLAGHVEPAVGRGAGDVRVVKSIYPPLINLDFRLTDANGKVIDSGERKLRDVGFLDRGTANSSEPYRFEKRLLIDWVNQEFGTDSKH